MMLTSVVAVPRLLPIIAPRGVPTKAGTKFKFFDDHTTGPANEAASLAELRAFGLKDPDRGVQHLLGDETVGSFYTPWLAANGYESLSRLATALRTRPGDSKANYKVMLFHEGKDVILEPLDTQFLTAHKAIYDLYTDAGMPDAFKNELEAVQREWFQPIDHFVEGERGGLANPIPPCEVPGDQDAYLCEYRRLVTRRLEGARTYIRSWMGGFCKALHDRPAAVKKPAPGDPEKWCKKLDEAANAFDPR
jgi:hypothetical protein